MRPDRDRFNVGRTPHVGRLVPVHAREARDRERDALRCRSHAGSTRCARYARRRAVRSRRPRARPRRARGRASNADGTTTTCSPRACAGAQGAPEWVFYEGPPTANGRPGIHHVWARSFKDLYPRFHTMRGQLRRPQGRLGLPRPPGRGRGREGARLPRTSTRSRSSASTAFNRRCRESVQRYVEDCRALTTPHRDVARHRRRLLDARQRLHRERVVAVPPDVGRAATSTRATRSCPTAAAAAPRCRATSSASPARTRTSPSRRSTCASRSSTATSTCSCGRPRRGRSISNVARRGRARRRVRAGARRRRRDRDLVLAAARVADGARRRRRGRRAGRRSTSSSACTTSGRSTSCRSTDGDACRVVAADFVTLDDGSGIVHLAPAFGEIDREVAEREGLPMLNPVGPDGRASTRPCPPYAGQFVKDADPALIDALAAAGRLVRVVDYTHSYPHCWRCGTPLIYWAKPDVVRAHVARTRTTLLRENETIGWHPEHIKHGRFGDWLENNVDWALSRDRFWGTPLPVWRCDDCGHDTCVGSVAELAELAGPRPRRPRPAPALRRRRRASTCPKCGGAARAASSRCSTRGSTPARCPPRSSTTRSRTTELFERRFPADFICEAIDQTRGWFYSLLAVNTLVFDRSAVPQRRVPRAARRPGRPEDVEVARATSSTRGRSSTPAAPTRCAGTSSPPGRRGRTRRVSVEAIDESTRRFLRDALEHLLVLRHLREPRRLGARALRPRRPSTHVLDRWVRSRLHGTVATVTDALDGFDALARRAGARALRRRPLELVRAPVARRGSGRRPTPRAHATLHECLAHGRAAARAVLPVRRRRAVPRTSTGATTESVHLADWPDVDVAAHRRRARSRDGARRAQVVTLGPRPATRPSSRCASRCRARSCCSPATSVLRRGRRRDRRRAEREARSRRSPTSRACSTTRWSRTSARSARRSAS